MRLAITWLFLVPAIFGSGNTATVIAGRDIHSTSNTFVNVVNVKNSEGAHGNPVNIVNQQYDGKSHSADKSPNPKLEEESVEAENATKGNLDGLISKLSHALAEELTKKSLNTTEKCLPNIEVLNISSEINVDLEPGCSNDTDSDHVGVHEHKGEIVVNIEFEEADVTIKNRTKAASTHSTLNPYQTTSSRPIEDFSESGSGDFTTLDSNENSQDEAEEQLSDADQNSPLKPKKGSNKRKPPIDIGADNFNPADDSNFSLNEREGAEDNPLDSEEHSQKDRVLEYVIDEPEDSTSDESNPPSPAMKNSEIDTEEQTAYDDEPASMPSHGTRNLPSRPQNAPGSKKPRLHPSKDRLIDHGIKKAAHNHSSLDSVEDEEWDESVDNALDDARTIPSRPSKTAGRQRPAYPPSKDRVKDTPNKPSPKKSHTSDSKQASIDQVLDYVVDGDDSSDYPSEPDSSSTSPETTDCTTDETTESDDQMENDDESEDMPSDETRHLPSRPQKTPGSKRPAHHPSKDRLIDHGIKKVAHNHSSLESVEDEEWESEFGSASSTLDDDSFSSSTSSETTECTTDETTESVTYNDDQMENDDESEDTPSEGTRYLPSRPHKTPGSKRPAHHPPKDRLIDHGIKTKAHNDSSLESVEEWESEFGSASSTLDDDSFSSSTSSETTESTTDETTESVTYNDDQMENDDESEDMPSEGTRYLPSRPHKTPGSKRPAHHPPKDRLIDHGIKTKAHNDSFLESVEDEEWESEFGSASSTLDDDSFSSSTSSETTECTTDETTESVTYNDDQMENDDESEDMPSEGTRYLPSRPQKIPGSKRPAHHPPKDRLIDHGIKTKAHNDSSMESVEDEEWESEFGSASSTLDDDSFSSSTSSETTECTTDETTESVTYKDDQMENDDESEDMPSEGTRYLPSRPQKTPGSKRPAHHPPKDRLIDHGIKTKAHNDSSLASVEDEEWESEFGSASSTLDDDSSSSSTSSETTECTTDETTESVTYNDDQKENDDESEDMPSERTRYLPSRPQKTPGSKRPAHHPSKDRLIDHGIKTKAHNDSSLESVEDEEWESEFGSASSTLDDDSFSSSTSSETTECTTDETTESVTHNDDQMENDDESEDMPSEGTRYLPSRPHKTPGSKRPAHHPPKDRLIDHGIKTKAHNDSSLESVEDEEWESEFGSASSTLDDDSSSSSTSTETTECTTDETTESVTYNDDQMENDYESEDMPSEGTRYLPSRPQKTPGSKRPAHHPPKDRLIDHGIKTKAHNDSSLESVEDEQWESEFGSASSTLDDNSFSSSTSSETTEWTTDETTESVTYNNDQMENDDESEDMPSEGTRYLPSRPQKTPGSKRPAHHPSKDRLIDHGIKKSTHKDSSLDIVEDEEWESEFGFASSTLDDDSFSSSTSSETTQCTTDETTESVTYNDDQKENDDESEDMPSEGTRYLPSRPQKTPGSKRPAHHPSKDRLIDHGIKKPTHKDSSLDIVEDEEWESEFGFASSTLDDDSFSSSTYSETTECTTDETTESVTYDDDQMENDDESADMSSDGTRHLPSRPQKTPGSKRPAHNPSKDRLIDHGIKKPAHKDSSLDIVEDEEWESEFGFASSTLDDDSFSSSTYSETTECTTDETTESVTYDDDQMENDDESADMSSDGTRHLPSRPQKTPGSKRPAHNPSKDRLIDHGIKKPTHKDSSLDIVEDEEWESEFGFASSTLDDDSFSSSTYSETTDCTTDETTESVTYNDDQMENDDESEDMPSEGTRHLPSRPQKTPGSKRPAHHPSKDRLIDHGIKTKAHNDSSLESVEDVEWESELGSASSTLDDVSFSSSTSSETTECTTDETTESVTYNDDQMENDDESEDMPSEGTRYLPSRPHKTPGSKRPAHHPPKDRLIDHGIKTKAHNDSSLESVEDEEWESEFGSASSTLDDNSFSSSTSSETTECTTDETTESVTYDDDQMENDDESADMSSDGTRHLPSRPQKTPGSKRPAHHPSKDRLIDYGIKKPTHKDSSLDIVEDEEWESEFGFASSTLDDDSFSSSMSSETTECPTDETTESVTYDDDQMENDDESADMSSDGTRHLPSRPQKTPGSKRPAHHRSKDRLIDHGMDEPMNNNSSRIQQPSSTYKYYPSDSEYQSSTFELSPSTTDSSTETTDCTTDATTEQVLYIITQSPLKLEGESLKLNNLTELNFEEDHSFESSEVLDYSVEDSGNKSEETHMDDVEVPTKSFLNYNTTSDHISPHYLQSPYGPSDSPSSFTTTDCSDESCSTYTTETYESSTSYPSSISTPLDTDDSSTEGSTPQSSTDYTSTTLKPDSVYLVQSTTPESTDSTSSSTNAYETSESSSESTESTSDLSSSSTNAYETSESSSESTESTSTNAYETSESSSESTLETTTSDRNESSVSSPQSSTETSSTDFQTSSSSLKPDSLYLLQSTTPESTESSSNSYETSDSSVESTSECSEASSSSTNTYETSESSSEYNTESTRYSTASTDTPPLYDDDAIEPLPVSPLPLVSPTQKPTIAPFPEACPPYTTSIELPFIPLMLLYPMVDSAHKPTMPSDHSVNPFGGKGQQPIKGGCVLCIPFGSDAMPVAPVPGTPNQPLSPYQLFMNQMLRRS